MLKKKEQEEAGRKNRKRNIRYTVLLWWLFLLGMLSVFFLFWFISNIEFEELSPYLVNSLVSTEDYRFYDHAGVDFKGVARAILYLGSRGGASTISQQLAKNLFTNVDRSNRLKRIIQKLKEWVIAIQLEKLYTKNEIITMYFNTMELSENTFGIKSAASTYFNKLPSELNIQEAATLVGMLKAPTSYNPYRKPEKSIWRRNIVIDQLKNFGGLEASIADSIKNTPLKLDYTTVDHNVGLAPYFREYLRGWLDKWCKDNQKIDGSNYSIYEDGLKIYTTINSKLQDYAERALVEHLPGRQHVFNDYFKDKKQHPWHDEPGYIEAAIKKSDRYTRLKKQDKSHEEILEIFDKKVERRLFSWEGSIDTLISPKDSIIYNKYILHAGFMAMEPGTGEVKAWVGGIDHRYYKYDNVKPTAKRQVGSTFKPFIYSLAVQNGWSPCQKVPNMPVTFDKYDNYTPENASSFREGEMVTLKDGLALSMNQITAFLMKDMNPQQTEDGYIDMTDFFKQMGIKSYILPVPSMCLGVADISVQEMVGAYGTFANKGVWVEPTFIKRIEDKNGNIIQEFTPEQVEALNVNDNYAMIELLRNVIDVGTARRLRKEPFDFANDMIGKTGTTQDNADGWFMGIIPNLVCGTWIGGDDKHITIKNTEIWSGASLGIPIFGAFMKLVYDDETLDFSEDDEFEMPRRYRKDLDCEEESDFLNPYASAGENNPNDPLNNAQQFPQKQVLLDSLGRTVLDERGLPVLYDPNNPDLPPGTQPGLLEPVKPIQKDDYYGDEFE